MSEPQAALAGRKRLWPRAAVCVVLAWTMTAFGPLPVAHAATLFVNNAATECGDGQTWATAYKYLQDALTAARNSGGTVSGIWVAAGIYQPDRDCAHPTGSGSRTATFQLISGVAIRGGFIGNEDPAAFDLASRSFADHPTILSGDLARNDGANFANNNENSYHVVTGSGTATSAVLEGFTISGGNANGTTPHSNGGGMYTSSGSPSIGHCTFSSNWAYQGGALYVSFGSPAVANCTFRDNKVGLSNGQGYGGGVFSENGSPTFVNCSFLRNISDVAGGLANYYGVPALKNCTFVGNTGEFGGGMLSAGYSINPSITNCIFWGNSANQVYVINGSITITYSCIQGGWTGAGNISSDPKLLFPAGGNARLRYGSPCIDAGDNAKVPAATTNDLDGNSRFVDDPETADTGNPGSPPGEIVDMGAYEYQPVSERRLYVKDNASGGGDGQTWSTAYGFLQDALATAQTDRGVTEIWVAGGVYSPDRDSAHPTGSGDRGATFHLLGGVGLYGGFPGQPGQEGNLSARYTGSYPSILSGDLARNDGFAFANNGENSYQVVTANAVGPTARLDGYTVIAGTRNASGRGGGFYGMYQSNPTLCQCCFRDNYGHAIYTDGTPAVVNCTIIHNFAGIGSDVNAVLTNCIVWGNVYSQVGGSPTITYSCVQGGWTGVGNISSDPRLMFVEGGNLRLRHGSPCIDAGNNAAVLTGTTRDLDGNSRFVDDPETVDTGSPGNPPQPVVDMGAYEYQAVSEKRLYVKASATPGGGGQTWSTAYTYLRDAFSAAQADPGVTEIWIAGGVYKPDRDAAHPAGTGNRNLAFQMMGGVKIYGGFPGRPWQEGNMLVRDPGLYPTVLSGDLADNDGPNFVNNGENSYHVVTASVLGAATTLDGATISGGNANDSTGSGGGLNVQYSNMSLRNLVWKSNCATSSGGGLYAATSTLTMLNCAFLGNGSSNSGGGVFNANSAGTFTNCTFSGNTVGTNGSGGGLCQSTNNSVLSNCVLWGNGGTQTFGSVTVTYSCVQGGYSGTGNISSNPRLLFDGQLHRGSPCIDAGNSATLPADVSRDVAWRLRFVDDPETVNTGLMGNPPRAVVDMGAYEYQPGAAVRLYVNANAAPGGNGASWPTAYRHLQDALRAPNPWVTEIWCAAGVYQPDRDLAHPTGTRDRTQTFQMVTGIALRGGFAGTEDPAVFDLANRKLVLNATILSGDLSEDDGPSFSHNGENSHHVVTGSDAGAGAILDGFIVIGGNANGTSPHNSGGGMCNTGATGLTVLNCTFSGNSSSTYGGGMWNSGSSPTITGCVFRANSSARGGGVYNTTGSSPTLTNCTFNGNSASSGYGAGVYTYSTYTVKNCILWGNVGSQVYGLPSPTVTYTCVQGGYTGQGNISSDPLFVNAAAGDLRLRAGSPCIDAGRNGSVPAGVTTDLDGRPRFVDNRCLADCVTAPGTCGMAPIVDMGAYEYGAAVDLNHDGTVSAADFDRFLAAFGHTDCDTSYNLEADFDGDGAVTLVDYQQWLQQYRVAIADAQAPPPLEVLGDFQRDGHIDEIDLDHIAACQTGAMVPQNDPACKDADLDGDADVDQDDFGAFQKCITGMGGLDLGCKY